MKARILLPLFLFCALGALPSMQAQVGNSNPTGPAGHFSGTITTGCAYDLFTGSASRSITDMAVPGAVGSYPLAFGRTANSRYLSGQFGQAAGWRHSYEWEINDSGTSTSSPSFAPSYYVVSFPDGRDIRFTFSSSDPYFRGPVGVKERFQPLNTSTLLAYLILPDGGKVEFKATRVSECDPQLIPPCTYSYTFQAQAIIDPYGLRTAFAYNGDGTLNTVQDASGRWLQLIYVTVNGLRIIDHVQGSDGRSVKYNYSQASFAAGAPLYTYLANVVYFGDSALTATYTYQGPNTGSVNGPPLLSTCDDPMYTGPMKKISYAYATGVNGDNSAVVYGQIRYEKSIDGQNVSNLQVITSGRAEAQGDGSIRYFDFPANGYQVSNWSKFGVFLPRYSNGYDAKGFLSSFQDLNGNTTNFVADPKTGNPTTVTFPLTPPDTTRATVTYTYGSATCPDPNNRDGNNPYYLYSVKDERDNVTTYLRDVNKRVIQINYPDGGVETFAYNSFGQVTSHRLRTGGLETYTYDTRGVLTQYRDAYHLATVDPQNPSVPASATPSFSYAYYTSGPSFDRLRTITDARSNVTTIDSYNSRGQPLKITHPLGQGEAAPSNVQYAYRADGVLSLKQDELGHRTYFSYDDYKRLVAITLPPRVTGDPLPTPTYFYYERTGGAVMTDYSHTDANPRRVVLPSGKRTRILYDSNLQKTSVTQTAADGTTDAATTSYTYDLNGNLSTVKDPNGQTTGLYAQYSYDARNRVIYFDDPMVNDATTPHRNSDQHTVSFAYDPAGNMLSQLNANNQKIMFTYDPMNRLLQRSVPQTPSPTATTKYTYFPSGLLNTMQDPHLVEISSSYAYAYTYDLMGRKTRSAYPPDTAGALQSEYISYDTAGNVATFTNRSGAIQTFTYDGRNRPISSTWSDGTTAPSLTYDAASRVTQISNADAVIKNVYFDDNTLNSQEEWATADAAYHRTVIYAYDADGNRGNIIYPSGKNYSYGYYGRNDLWYVLDNATGIYQAAYIYDASSNVTTRYVGNNWIVTDASQRNPLNQIKHLEHRFVGTTRSFDYTYNSMGSRTSIKRDNGAAENYGYDLAQEVTTGIENGGAATYTYDANGNRKFLNNTGTYVTNDLSQPTTYNGQAVGYNNNGDVTKVGNSATGIYDAENRLINDGATTTFKYDGLNRKISQTIGGVTTYNVWDGWNLIEERGGGNVLQNTYLYGAGEIVERMTGAAKYFYFQDALGSTSHVSDESANLLENYKYDTFGQPRVYSPAGVVRATGSSYDIRHLFTGQLWISQFGVYDYRNRLYSPYLTRFIQPDPIGFAGDPTNLYRYCGGDPVNKTDPFGLLEKTRTKPSTPPIKPLEAVPFGSNGYTPTGSLIPQSVTGTWNGGSWDLSTHDYVNGTQSIGSFVLVGGLTGEGSNGNGGGAVFVSTSSPFGRAIELATRALDSDKVAGVAKRSGSEVGGVVVSNGQMHVDDPGTRMTGEITILPGTIATFHIHFPIGRDPYSFSDPQGGGLDEFLLTKLPNIPHLIGVLDGPPGQFTILVHIPDGGVSIQRPNPGHTPGFPGGG